MQAQANPWVLDKIIEYSQNIDAMAASIGIQPKPLTLKEKILAAKALEIVKTEGNEQQIFHKLMDSVEAHAETATGPVLSFKEKIALKKKLAAQAEIDAMGESADDISIQEEQDEFDKAKVYADEVQENQAAPASIVPQQSVSSSSDSSNGETSGTTKQNTESFSLSVVLNEKQLAAKEMAYSGKSFCLIGAAGTGKTTTQREVAESLLLDDRLSISKYKTYDRVTGARKYVTAPSIAFVAYTRRAASNLAKAILKSPTLAEKLQDNIMTIHALLEYEPETYMDLDENKEKFRFRPMRDAMNPLDITHLIIEEASMLGVSDLWPKLFDALPAGVQIIFIGDINQLPPVFGPSILNYALVQLPIVELTQGYRNQGIVLENAWNILDGKDIVETERYQVIRGKKQEHSPEDNMAHQLGNLFKIMSETEDEEGYKLYDPEDCIVLSPFKVKPLGTENINRHIAQFLGEKRGAIVYEVIAGFNKHYLAVGDKVMFNKVDAVITSIEVNPDYFGKTPQLPGADLTRFGHRNLGQAGMGLDALDDAADYSNFSLEAIEEQKAERKQQASHVISIKYGDDRTDSINAVGDLGEQTFTLGYCLTVHKAQGSEWRKVFIILHKNHAIMLYRELLYTAATRARTDVTIIAKDVTIKKAIANQRIKGRKLKDKLEFFNSKIDKYADVQCVKY
ncbi:putative DNA helicase [Polaromonas phage Tiera]|nr:putative DNA helicase [Polaromonas phage Tiera]